jgi:hypothetical protein
LKKGEIKMTEKNKQTEANKKWQEKNKEHAKYLSNRSRSRSFIRNQATFEDLEELEQLIAERKKDLAQD